MPQLCNIWKNNVIIFHTLFPVGLGLNIKRYLNQIKIRPPLSSVVSVPISAIHHLELLFRTANRLTHQTLVLCTCWVCDGLTAYLWYTTSLIYWTSPALPPSLSRGVEDQWMDGFISYKTKQMIYICLSLILKEI